MMTETKTGDVGVSPAEENVGADYQSGEKAAEEDGALGPKGTGAPSGQYGTFHPASVDTTPREPREERTVSGAVPGARTYIYVYCSHFLSAWGDRMWSFGVGLFLVRIAGDSLQLPAAYGLASGLTIFLLGALVGDWVDSTPRLRAAQLSLVAQNLLVVVCAAGVYLYLRFEDQVRAVGVADGRGVAEGGAGGVTGAGGWAVPVCQAGIILLAVLADVTSLARVIAVERDWIVKICGSDTDTLAKMTATLRRIDQTTLIVAPIVTGQVMTYAGLEFGALFVGVWNLCSVGLEYYLMWKVYTTIPALAHKPAVVPREDTPVIPQKKSAEEKMAAHFSQGHRSEVADTEILLEDSRDLDPNDAGKVKATTSCCSGGNCCWRVLSQFVTLYRGWRTYMKYSVALAGLALACLYMTVLGFDNITVAYAVTQGVSESILGVLMGVSACFGMLGTFLYPALRRRVGLVRTGLLALSSQLVCLALCVVSVWMPGSPFDPGYAAVTTPAALVVNVTSSLDMTSVWSTRSSSPFPSAASFASSQFHFAGDDSTRGYRVSDDGLKETPNASASDLFATFSSLEARSVLSSLPSFNGTTEPLTFSPNGTTQPVTFSSDGTTQPTEAFSTAGSTQPLGTTEPVPPDEDGDSRSYQSVVLLMTGIVLARFGLWTADLAITQMFLEAVVESERGVVNGVQSSLNKLMDVLKFALVVAIPDTQTFGFLIIVSFLFICLGWVFYAVFLRRNRGHFFHCSSCCYGAGEDYARMD